MSDGAAVAGRVLRVEGLTHGHGHGPVLQDISFTLAPGDTLSIIGPSGCGKSTLLHVLAGLARPDQGQIDCGGPGPFAAPHAAGQVALIQQDYGLFPWKTVEENLALPLVLRGDAPCERHATVHAMLAELRLEGLGSRYPAALSGGQRQRVAIGRALITRPGTLLMDEPFSSLDAITRERLHQVLLEVWRAHRPTCVLVTHDVSEAVFLGKYVMVLGGTPASARLWLENPYFGDPSCREKQGYFTLTRTVHAALAATLPPEANGRGDPCVL